MTSYKVSASIVLYKTRPELVSALLGNLPRHIQVVIVDNSPTSGLEAVVSNRPEVVYCHTPVNFGYGRGHNHAMALTSPSDFHLILNPDIVVGEATIDELCSFLKKEPRVAIVSPRVLNRDGSAQYLNRRFPTVLDLFLRRIPPRLLPKALVRRMQWCEMRDVGYDHVTDVECLSGSFLLCRRSAIEAIGGFDDRYFMYFEDFDLCLQLQAKGWRTAYYPSTPIIHHWERASSKQIRMTLIHIRSMIRFFNKWGWRWL